MKVILNEVNGIADAIIAMHMSKRTYNTEMGNNVRDLVKKYFYSRNENNYTTIGDLTSNKNISVEEKEKVEKWIKSLCKWGVKHITLLSFIDLSFTVEGLHRAGQDDWDSHAKRFDNRIVRSSTRLASFDYEMSDWYKDKIIPTDVALNEINIPIPDSFEKDGKKYVKTINGYVDEKYIDNQDVKRGLYMLSIPSNFIFRCNLAQFAHVYKQRNKNSGANPEVKEMCETMVDILNSKYPFITRELLLAIEN